MLQYVVRWRTLAVGRLVTYGTIGCTVGVFCNLDGAFSRELEHQFRGTYLLFRLTLPLVGVATKHSTVDFSMYKLDVLLIWKCVD